MADVKSGGSAAKDVRARLPAESHIDLRTVASKPRRGRRWAEVVDKIYARADEPWVKIEIGGVEIAEVRQGSYFVLIAPQGAGKSSLALQMLAAHARDVGPAVYATGELDDDEGGGRVIGQWHGASWAEVLRGRVPREAVPNLPRLDTLDRDEATLERLAETVEALRLEYPGEPIMAVWDHLQASPDNDDERMRVAKLSTALRRLAKRLGIVILGVSQSSRDGARKLRSGELAGADAVASGAESAQIERDGYVVLTLGGKQLREDGFEAWALSIAKHRMGVADVVVPLIYEGRIGRWKVVGAPRPAADVKADKQAAGEATTVKRLVREIPHLLDKASDPMSGRSISLEVEAKAAIVRAAIKVLLAQGDGGPMDVVQVGPLKPGGYWPSWTRRAAEAAGRPIIPAGGEG